MTYASPCNSSEQIKLEEINFNGVMKEQEDGNIIAGTKQEISREPNYTQKDENNSKTADETNFEINHREKSSDWIDWNCHQILIDLQKWFEGYRRWNILILSSTSYSMCNFLTKLNNYLPTRFWLKIQQILSKFNIRQRYHFIIGSFPFECSQNGNSSFFKRNASISKQFCSVGVDLISKMVHMKKKDLFTRISKMEKLSRFFSK